MACLCGGRAKYCGGKSYSFILTSSQMSGSFTYGSGDGNGDGDGDGGGNGDGDGDVACSVCIRVCSEALWLVVAGVVTTVQCMHACSSL